MADLVNLMINYPKPFVKVSNKGYLILWLVKLQASIILHIATGSKNVRKVKMTCKNSGSRMCFKLLKENQSKI